MDKSETTKRSEYKQAPTERALNQSSSGKKVKKFRVRDHSIKWSKTNKKLIKAAIESAVNRYLSSNVKAPLTTEAGKHALSHFVLTNIGTTISNQMKSSVPTTDIDTPHEASGGHLQGTQTLNLNPIRRAQIPANHAVNVPAIQKTGDSLNSQVRHLSLDAQPLGSCNDDQAVKKREFDEPEAMTMSDPAVFTIRLGVANDNSFAVLFNDKRVIEGLALLSPYEKLQLFHDAIYHDPGIPNRKFTRPWITYVTQLNDGCLAFRTENKNDVHTLTTNVQWARSIRDIIAAGVKTYRLVIKDGNMHKLGIKDYKDRASIIDEIRKENTKRLPWITRVGVIRDVMLREGQVQQRQPNNYAQYIVTFGSREAANAALDMGLFLYGNYCTCITYSPMTQWHQQCSNCQEHGHIAKGCVHQPICGRCSSRHLLQSCKSVTIECANCHGRHVAFSRICPRLLEAEDKAHRAYRFPAEEFSMPHAQVEAKELAKATIRPPAQPISLLNKSLETALTSSKPAPIAREKISQVAPVNIKKESTSSSAHSPLHQASKQPPTATKHISQLAPASRNKGSASSTTTSTLQVSNQPQTARKHITQPAATTPNTEPPSSTTTPSALLQTIDAFRALVEARENETFQAHDPAKNSKQALTQTPNQKKRKTEQPPQQEHEYMMSGALQVDGHDGKRVKREEEIEDEGPVWPIGQSG